MAISTISQCTSATQTDIGRLHKSLIISLCVLFVISKRKFNHFS